MKKTWFALAAVLALSACEGASDPLVCPPIFSVSANVTVVDSISGANVTPGATLVLRNAAGVDSVVAPTAPVTTMWVGTRTGTFTLTVRQVGYRVWMKPGVVVKGDECGPHAVSITARLQPE